MTTLISSGSLIQSSFGFDGAHNLEAVITRSLGPGRFALQHYWRPTDHPDNTWKRGAIITEGATGPAALCQRHDHDNVRGNFEVVVLEEGGQVHYWLDNSQSGAHEWNRVAGFAASGATGAGAICENRSSSHLEMVVLHGNELVHHRFDGHAWKRLATISNRANGTPALMQSDYGNNLEAIVAEYGNLVLYWYDGTPWHPGGLITAAGDGPFGFAQGRYGNDPNRNFELVVPRGDTLTHYWRDNSRKDVPWRSGGLATWGAGKVEAAALCSSDLGVGGGWLQTLTQEGISVYHLYRFPVEGDFRWMRGACIRLDDIESIDVDRDHARSSKIAQISGEQDAQTGRLTLSVSRSAAGIHGTDLGVTVTHANRRFLLFGDTHWDDPCRITLDSIAEVMEGAGDSHPKVTFHGSPLAIIGGDVTQREYDVPLDAFSLAGQFFVFFSSDHFTEGRVMGRSILTRALDPAVPIDPAARNRDLQYQLLTTFSSYRFINVSVQLQPGSKVPGFGGDGHVLLVWGSGAYRADDLRLAVIDLRDPAIWSYLLGNRPFPAAALPISYFAGLLGDTPLWSVHEQDARPLLWPGALGELSVRWVPELSRYLLLAMAGPEDPIGAAVWLRTARHPWGPWSRRRQMFDWVLDGMGHRNRAGQFIHDAEANPPDFVGDCVFPEQCDSGGAAYAPYLHDVKIADDIAVLWYTLSTWNPYQAMLMQHEVRLVELRRLELQAASSSRSETIAMGAR